MVRPRILVLAGVNGAGKSSVGGDAVTRSGTTWFNPDDHARDLMTSLGYTPTEANAEAWQEGMRRLMAALAKKRDYAFETTLGGNSIPARLREATASHDVLMWYCGLDSPEHHIARVKFRVSRGGHDIAETKIRERYISSQTNLIALMPHLTRLQVYDNSTDAPPGQPIPNPRLLLQMEQGRIAWPVDVATLQLTPHWAKPILATALSLAL